MPHRRGVAASVLRTLLFHVASLAFACVLSVFFLVTGSALLLVVGCLLVGSSQFARKLTRILWRSEMAINALVAEEGELAVRRRPGTLLGEVTLPVMLLSMLYFLVFKWILNVVFSVVPLVTWAVSVAQVLPEDAGLADLSLVVTGTTAAQAFTAVAFAFLAHQIGVTSARGLLFVSRIVAGVLFSSSEREETREQEMTDRAPFTVQGDDTRALERRKVEAEYGTMRVKQHKPSAEVVTWNLNREPRTVRIRQKHAEWKQGRYERKARKYELKLRAARDKIDGRRGDTTGLLERYIEAKERDRYAREIEQVAVEAFHVPETKQDAVRRRLHSSDDAKARASRHATVATAPPMDSPALPLFATPVPIAEAAAAPALARLVPRAQPSGDPRKRALSSRARGRPSTLLDHQVRPTSDVSDHPDRIQHNEREDKRPVSVAPVSQAASAHDISDMEIQGRYGNIARSYEEDDVTNMRAYAPLSYTGSPPQYITALDPSPIYRGPSEQPDYDSFSPVGSPRSGTARGSFGDIDHDYDVLSPTNSVHDAEFPTDKFQHVYRSIQMAAVPPPRRSASLLAAEEGGLDAKSEFKSVPGHRDRVNFSAFAPPSVCPAPKPFRFTVWAFLLNQRAEMQELARSDHPESQKLSLETKLDVRRGALVHVTLEVPNGFQVLNGATQGFAWEGEISNVDYDVVCTEGAAFGRVLFKARITVGSSVAVLNSFVLVGSRTMDPSELEADVLEGWMDVMEQTYREIPFRSLEMKELVGQGYFGDAYRATLDGQDVVVKTIRASEFGETTSQIVREFQHEAAMLNMFGHHPCIVPFVGASTDTKFPLALVTQYLPYGSLEDNLRVPNSSPLSLDERTGMLKDAAAGLLNIHEGGFIHRDLAARNCLVDQGNHVRICDFGLCRRVKSETAGMLMKDAVGPVKYMAPESLQPPHAFSYDSDVYMFGVLMWETYTNSSPFASLTSVEAMMHVLRGERLPVPRELPASLQRLMQNCFHDSPAERPSMQEVLMALDDSLISSQRASVAIAATTAVATATAAAATSTAMAKSVTSRTNLRKEQDRSIWV
ncbi:hypothetical protein PR003_g7307 [Phytophthora rubi]|uniref:Protein kinase domain-containing protein n=1 Tax=Phytophthora rubi TaxID=129364 RepID=A0A6A4G0E4_9STRA|nr:hypothetical protein PR003_g7307 [Phytophthora rubi]